MFKVTRTIDKRLRDAGLIHKVSRVDYDGVDFPVGYFSDRQYARMVAAALNDLASVEILG